MSNHYYVQQSLYEFEDTSIFIESHILNVKSKVEGEIYAVCTLRIACCEMGKLHKVKDASNSQHLRKNPCVKIQVNWVNISTSSRKNKKSDFSGRE